MGIDSGHVATSDWIQVFISLSISGHEPTVGGDICVHCSLLLLFSPYPYYLFVTAKLGSPIIPSDS